MDKTYTALVRTIFLLKSPARHVCGFTDRGLRAKGWGSTMLRVRVRSMARIGVAEGIVFGRR